MKANKKSKPSAPAAVAAVSDPAAEHPARRRENWNPEDSGLTYLQVGDIVDLGPGLGGEHIVWKCNDCRATCIPLTRKAVAFTRHGSGEEVRYAAHLKPIGISPNSEVPILRRLGKAGMIEFLENQNKESESSMAKDKENKAKKETSDEPKLGRLGGFKGYAITAVIRAMAVAGWEYWECRAVFDAAKIPVADNTIRIQLSAGRAGKGGDPAPLSKKALAEMRPDPDDKPAAARKAKADKPAKKKAKVTKPAADEDEDEADEADEEPAPKAKKKAKPAPVEDEDEEEADEEPAAADEDDE